VRGEEWRGKGVLCHARLHRAAMDDGVRTGPLGLRDEEQLLMMKSEDTLADMSLYECYCFPFLPLSEN
jgi:hypothetical protein